MPYDHNGIQNLTICMVNLFAVIGKQILAGFFSDRNFIAFDLLSSKDLAEVFPSLELSTWVKHFMGLRNYSSMLQ